MAKAAKKQDGKTGVELQDDIAQKRQRARALDVPEKHAYEPWATSLAGCMIFMAEYPEELGVQSIKNGLWQTVQDYHKVLDDESKALSSPKNFGGGAGSASYEDDSDAYVDFCERAKSRAKLLRGRLVALQHSQGARVNVYEALYFLEDGAPQEAWRKHVKKFPQLRIVLNSIDKFLGERAQQ